MHVREPYEYIYESPRYELVNRDGMLCYEPAGYHHRRPTPPPPEDVMLYEPEPWRGKWYVCKGGQRLPRAYPSPQAAETAATQLNRIHRVNVRKLCGV